MILTDGKESRDLHCHLVIDKVCDTRPVTLPVHASLTSSTKWGQCLLCYDQGKRPWCTPGTSVRSEHTPGLPDRILIGTGGGSEPRRLLGLVPPGTWVSHIQLLASFCSSDSMSYICSFLLSFCLSPGTEAYYKCLDHYGGPLSGLFDSRLCCLRYYSRPFLATPVYSRIFPRTTFWASPHSDTPSGFSGPIGQHLNCPHGKSSVSIFCPHPLHPWIFSLNKYLLKTCQASGTELDAGELK